MKHEIIHPQWLSIKSNWKTILLPFLHLRRFPRNWCCWISGTWTACPRPSQRSWSATAASTSSSSTAAWRSKPPRRPSLWRRTSWSWTTTTLDRPHWPKVDDRNWFLTAGESEITSSNVCSSVAGISRRRCAALDDLQEDRPPAAGQQHPGETRGAFPNHMWVGQLLPFIWASLWLRGFARFMVISKVKYCPLLSVFKVGKPLHQTPFEKWGFYGMKRYIKY